MRTTRRDFSVLLPALLASLQGAAAGQQQHPVLSSAVYEYEHLVVHPSGDHSSRPVFTGDVRAGVSLSLHETELRPGARPHPPHHHAAEEMFLIREGTVEVEIGGKYSRLGPGSVAYIASNIEHGISNPGPGSASYFVLQLNYR